MTDIYLTENRRQAIVVRSLQLIDKYCRLLTSDSTQEPLEGKEMDAVQCILEYCHNEIQEQLKKCEFFAVLTDEETAAELASHSVSFITRAGTGTYCVFAKQAEEVLAEFQKLNICKTIQQALKTGKHVLLARHKQ